jgi:16S rRNA (uracil1498-N3)-methyltransferase
MTSSPATRLYVAPDLAAGAALALPPEQAHYLGTVLRLAPGAVIAVFNGRDGEWAARLDALGKSGAALTLLSRRLAQTEAPDLWLLFAPIKRARIDFLVEKATELGVAELHPVLTRRTTVERVNLDRLRAHAIEAAEQTERLSVPRLVELLPLERKLAQWPSERRLLLCDESGTAPPIGEVLAIAAPGAWAVLTGPEGGFAETELDALRKLPFVCPVGLGPRILRADTAALSALAVFQALLGDWQALRRR